MNVVPFRKQLLVGNLDEPVVWSALKWKLRSFLINMQGLHHCKCSCALFKHDHKTDGPKKFALSVAKTVTCFGIQSLALELSLQSRHT
jgi:hypothetical protein